jgi:hypothetical protein
MIQTIFESSTFKLDPVLYDRCYLVANLDDVLAEFSGIYQGDTVYVCSSLYSAGTISTIESGDTTSNYSFIVGSGTTFTPAMIGRTLHINDSTAGGVYVIFDSTSANTLKVGRTGRNAGEENMKGTRIGLSYVIAGWTEFSDGTSVRDAFLESGFPLRKSFTGRDFQTFRDEGLSYIQKNFGDNFNDFVVSDTGIMLLELLAFQAESMTWYIDYLANELSLKDALQVESVSDWANTLGYKPAGGTASSVDETITLQKVYAFDVLIPQGTKLTTKQGIIFETSEDVVFTTVDSTAGSTAVVTVVQGSTSVNTFVSTGQALQEFALDDIPPGLILIKAAYPFGGIDVRVNGVPWEEVDILDLGDQNVYEVDYLSSPPVVSFGDGVTGNIPAQGATITITKKAGNGSAGNVISNSINSLVVPVSINGQVISLAVTNAEGAAGGSDPEVIESIRSHASLNFASAQRLVSQADWDNLASNFKDSQYGAVAKAKCYISRGVLTGSILDVALTNLTNGLNSFWSKIGVANNDITVLLNQVVAIRSIANSFLGDSGLTNHVVVYVFMLDTDGFYTDPSSGLLTALYNYLEGLKMINCTHECVTGMSKVVKCGVGVAVNIKTGYIFTNVSIDVLSAVENVMKNRNFGDSLYLSQLYAAVTAVDGVDYCEITIVPQAGFESYLVNGNFILSNSGQVISRADGNLTAVFAITEL